MEAAQKSAKSQCMHNRGSDLKKMTDPSKHLK